MKTRIITYLSVLGVLLILASQAYIVYENYQQTRKSLIRESDAIIEEAFKKDVTIRLNLYKHLTHQDTATVIPAAPKTPDTKIDMSKFKEHGNNSFGLLDLAISNFVGSKIPLEINRLDSLTGNILKAHDINSAYSVNIIDSLPTKVVIHSTKDFKSSALVIHSKMLLIDFQRKKSLQLILINPFQNIFKRIWVLLTTSFLLSLFCFYGLWFLFRTQARQKKLMAVKNDFFGNTAHELKRPVALLHLALEALSKPTVFDNEMKRERYLSISRDASKDMSEKITMIMTLSMAEEGVFKLNYSHFNLLEEVQKLKEQFSVVADKEVTIQIENTADDCSIQADLDHIRQCLANLLDNAIKYSGGSVLISITLKKLKDSFCISVKDNGIGINADKLDCVFNKYTRLNTEAGSPTGFGIGLSYVKAVVEKHKGRVEVLSEPQKGSVFSVYIPI
jgi:two-component system, OmpR family, phosphate regulon sensor histidine kinase PhoR